MMGARARAGERGLRSICVREVASARSRCAVDRETRRPGAAEWRVLVGAAYRGRATAGVLDQHLYKDHKT